MAQVSYPGVYVQESSSGVHTITGVSTSIAAFFGRAATGPINKAVRILSLADYARTFGAAHPSSELAESVGHFFDNGGSDCYVVRLAHDAHKADLTLRNIDGVTPKNVLTATAKSEGEWGLGIKLEIDYKTPNPDESFNLTVIQEAAGVVVGSENFTNLSMQPTSARFAPTFVTASSDLIDLKLHADMGDPTSGASYINTIANTPAGYSQSRSPIITAPLATFRTALTTLFQTSGRFAMSVNGGNPVSIDLSALDVTTAANVNAVATLIQNEINTQLNAAVLGLSVLVKWDVIGTVANANILRFTSNCGDFSSVKILRSGTKDLAAPLMMGLDQGGVEVVRYSNMRPVYTGSVFAGGSIFGDITNAANGLNNLAGVASGAITSITIAGSAAIPLNLATYVDGTKPFYQDGGGGNDGVREKLRLVANAINLAAVPWKAEVWGYHLAVRRTGPGSINGVGAVTTAGPLMPPGDFLGAGFIANVKQYNLGATGAGAYQNGAGAVGANGTAPVYADYVGSELNRTGFYALDVADLFNLMVLPADKEVPAATQALLWGPASDYCATRRAFLLIDAPAAWTNKGLPVVTDIDVNSLRATVTKDYSAVFYPRVTCPCGPGNSLIQMGSSGMIAGVMARTDSMRGVWKAPAGVDASLMGAIDLEVKLTDNENGVLNKLGVNCARVFPSGIVNWGARTMDGSDDIGSQWKYISIRRTALFIEESLYRGTQWVVFEGNDEPLWAKIRLNIGAFMMGLFRQGAFQGSTPDTAYFVKCDGDTTTQADRDLGIVNVIVGFAPLKPAEFVVITLQQIAGQL